MSRKGSFLALRDRPAGSQTVTVGTTVDTHAAAVGQAPAVSAAATAPSRQGKKAITGYFSPDMSFAMHTAARRHNMSLQDAMADAFNDWLRKMGESPVGQ